MQPSYGRPQYAPEPPALSVTRARPWLIGLAASATMLVFIVAIGNPPVTRAVFRHAVSSDFGSRALQSLAYFAWDFGRLGDDMHLGWADLIFDLAVLALVLLLVAALSAGTGSFWRTFLAVWVSVIVAVLLCGYVRAAIIDPMGSAPGNSKAEVIFFSQYSPGPLLLFVAMLYGLVAALVAALVAVLTRRNVVVTADRPSAYAPTAEPEPAAAQHQRVPWSAPPAAVPGPVGDPSPWSKTDAGAADDRTTQLPAVGTSGQTSGQTAGQTAEQPAGQTAGQPEPTEDAAEHTRALPRIDDDDRPQS